MDPKEEEGVFSVEYWQNRYAEGRTGWDIGRISPPLKRILDGIEDKDAKILIPGAGNAYEAEYAFKQGFRNIYVCDWSSVAFDRLMSVVPEFPKENLLIRNYFELEIKVDYILEQTFFCALPPSKRQEYILKSATFLNHSGVLTGVLFASHFPFAGPPFGGTAEEYKKLWSTHFEIEHLEPCKDSINPRLGNELFLKAIKK